MATWVEVKQYIFQNFNVKSDSGNHLLINVEGGGRSQLVSVVNIENFLMFSSPFAEVGQVQPGQVLAASQIFGVALMGEYYNLRNVTLIDDLDVNELNLSIVQLAAQADEIEGKLMRGGDKF